MELGQLRGGLLLVQRWVRPDGGADPGDWSSDGPDGGPPLGGEAYLYVPRVTIDDPAFATDGWKTTNLATCAALVDASGFHGFSLHGKAGGAGASMRVLAIGADDFLVELRDDASVGRRDAAASGEGLEVWAAGEEPDRCPHESLSVEWLVRADDGRVTAGFGTPGVAALSVTRATDGAVVRLKLHLTAPHTALAFAYRDSKQRVFATSRERPGDAASLGVLRVLDPKDASCRVVAGGDAAAGRRLEPVDRRGEPPPLAN